MAGGPILVLAEPHGSGVAPIEFELLSVALTLAQGTGREVIAAIAGSGGTKAAAGALLERGAKKVYVAEHSALEDRRPEPLARAIQAICSQAHPDLVLVGQTDLGRDLAPYLAQRLGTGVVMNCIELRRDGRSGELEAVCPVYGGVAQAEYRFGPARPCVVALRARAAKPAALAPGAVGPVIDVDPGLDSFPRRVEVISESVAEGPRLESARVIVSGGLGLQEKENYRHIEELAGALGGVPAASRAIVDRGWVPPAQQVGITGRSVAPALYIAIGISGASQHMAGISHNTAIVAVNTDRNAAIFRHARFGIVKDANEFVPALLEEVKQRKGKP